MKKYILGVFLVSFLSVGFAQSGDTCQYNLTLSFNPAWIANINPFLAEPAYLQLEQVQLRDTSDNYISTLYEKYFPINSQHTFPSDPIKYSGTTTCGSNTINFMYQVYNWGVCGGNSHPFTTTAGTTTPVNLVFPDDFSLTGTCLGAKATQGK